MMSKKSKKAKEAPKAPGPEKRAVPKLPKEREPLRTFLTIMLVLVGTGELALLGYMGLCAREGVQTRREYEAQQTGQTSGTSSGTILASYAGPWLRVENGVVTWEWEEGRPAGLQKPGEPEQEKEKRLASITTLTWNYALAEMDEPETENPENPEEGDQPSEI